MLNEGKVCLVTGAANGIGLAYARAFSREGYSVALADIDLEGAERRAEELRSEGCDAIAVTVDIASASSCQEAVDATHGHYARIDVLINNAAIYSGIDLTNNDPEYLEQIMSVNMLGPWRMSRAVVPVMIEQERGCIINQASDGAYFHHLGALPAELPSFSYAWSKWGVVGLTKFMAGALGGHNITVNTIAPGTTMTDATKQVVSPKLAERLKSMTALNVLMEPEEIAEVGVFLASDAAAKLTGQILCVDGGAVMPG